MQRLSYTWSNDQREHENDLEFLRRGYYGIDVFGSNLFMAEVSVVRA
jgi:hypothetical protein